MRNILLIILPYKEDSLVPSTKRVLSFKAFPYGVLSIATYIKNNSNDINVEIIDCNVCEGDYMSFVEEKLIELKPDVVGISMMFDISYRYLNKTINIIKGYSDDTIIVLGGSSATSSYDILLREQNNVDGICYYEGEVPFLRLVNSKDMLELLDTDPSWITKKSIEKGMVPKKSLVINLDEVIHLDYNLVDISKYEMSEAFSPFSFKRDKTKQFFIITSRGCPYSCTFCMHSADKDKSIRYASVEEIIKHIELLVYEKGMGILTIYDDQLLLNKKRAKKLFKELARFNIRIECPNGLAVAFIDDEMAKLMSNAGMDSIYLAIESGSPRVLNKIIHKPLNLKMVKPVVEILRKYGFWIQGYFVSGMPGETDEDRDKTVKFIKEVGLDWASFTLAIPSKGSVLYNICIENGYIRNDLGIDEINSNRFIINTPEYSSDYVVNKTYLMNLDVNFVNNYRMMKGEYGITIDCLTNVIRRRPDHAFACYYLSEILFSLNENLNEAQIYRDNFNSIIKEDNKWKEYAEQFCIVDNLWE